MLRDYSNLAQILTKLKSCKNNLEDKINYDQLPQKELEYK